MNDFLIFLVLAGLALIFRWLTNQAANDSEESEAPPPPNESVKRGPTESEEQRVRRFLEALGVPQGTQPPPRVKPRAVVPRRVVTPQAASPKKVRRTVLQPLPPLVTTPDEPPLPPPASFPEPTMPVEETPATLPPVLPSLPSASAPAVVRRRSAPIASPVVSRSSLGQWLRSPESIRQAIILREVLGPPRGFRPLAEIDLRVTSG